LGNLKGTRAQQHRWRLIRRVFFLLLAGSVFAQAGIDLTPRSTVTQVDGVESPKLEFRDNAVRITYAPPTHWRTLSLSPAKLQLVPPDNASAHATIEVVEAGLSVFDAEGVELRRQQILALTPGQAQDRWIEAEEVNPVAFNGHPTCEVTASFIQDGQRLKMSVLFVDLGNSHLRFTLLCRGSEFEKLHGCFRASIASWQWQPSADARHAAVR
jgi:hypothetical protein